jgi:hypothetical protein
MKKRVQSAECSAHGGAYGERAACHLLSAICILTCTYFLTAAARGHRGINTSSMVVKASGLIERTVCST